MEATPQRLAYHHACIQGMHTRHSPLHTAAAAANTCVGLPQDGAGRGVDTVAPALCTCVMWTVGKDLRLRHRRTCTLCSPSTHPRACVRRPTYGRSKASTPGQVWAERSCADAIPRQNAVTHTPACMHFLSPTSDRPPGCPWSARHTWCRGSTGEPGRSLHRGQQQVVREHERYNGSPHR